MNKIPPVDLTRQYQLIKEEADLAVLKILNSGRYIGGEAITTFEREFANYIGVAECVSCNSGTDALFLALKALNIGEGDEVITTPFSFFATAEVITRVGAKPIFIDIDLDTFNLDLAQIEQAITLQTKAIIPVHIFGQPMNMTKLMEIAESHDLYVIEDCAQATGATWEQDKIGSIGHVGCFSFFPTKNLGACGDGGAITTNNLAIAKQMRILKEHGSPLRYRHDFIGINSRIDAVQAVILTIKLRYLDYWNEQRQTAAQYYQELLQSVSLLKLPQAIVGGDSVWNQYTVCIADSQTAIAKDQNLVQQTKRDLVKQILLDKGIISMIYYPIPLHLQPVYQALDYQTGQLPKVEQAAREVLSLPMFPGISEAEQEQVAYALKDCLVEI
ncbi:DegT/DnrJ/EryC1/StrS family aminotransferase [Pleurocapsales cyanobacterium LEGE 10410]|nr:DegT/DnrJ/EryC1/StrS family aminotransferase [Pleurocapsales cyanobacterium LEGE 10410]